MTINSALYSKILATALLASLAIGPAFAATDVEQGISLYNARNYSAAKLCFDRATRANPADWQAQYYLGHCCYALGQMPQARYAYQMAMHHGVHPTVKAQCQAGLDNIDKYKNQTLKPTSSTTVAIASKDAKGENDEEETADPNSPQAKAEKAKTEIMQHARAEISKIRKAAQEQIQFESENSNTICKYPDGHKALDIPYQRVDAINAEAEEKCTRIMNEAEAKCRGYH